MNKSIILGSGSENSQMACRWVNRLLPNEKISKKGPILFFRICMQPLFYFVPWCIFGVIHISSAQQKEMVQNISFSHDNDALKFRGLTDRYYSFGLFLARSSVLKPESKLALLTQRKGVDPSEKLVLSTELFLKGFTPEYEEDVKGEPRRPFAGISGFSSTLSFANYKRIWTMGALLGVRGKISGAQYVQYRFHQLISSPIFDGWKEQLPNKFLYAVKGSYIKPVTLLERVRAISHTNMILGNYQIQLEQNFGVQIGIFNRADRSSLFNNFIDRATSNKNEYYVYASVFGKAIATDATLASASNQQEWVNPLNKRNRQVGYQVRLISQIRRLGFQAGYTRVSTESNVSERHSYGTLGISYAF